MDYPTAQPVHPARSHSVDGFDTDVWPERREVEESTFLQASADEQTFAQILSSLPDWAVISAGGLVAAILGAMVGGALHI